MKIDIFTIFPDMLLPLTQSILGKAIEKGIISIEATDIRDYTLNKHNKVDDYPFGGGVGMLMQTEPIFRAFEAKGLKPQGKQRMIYMSPRGKILNQEKIAELSKEEHLVVLCGHYEGVDQRILDYWNIEEISIGDYILTGGEPAAVVMIDSVARMIPGVLGDKVSVTEESIYSGLLEYPQYTKPREYRGLEVPEVLISGHHKNISLWQFEESLKITKKNRYDLFKAYLESEKKLSKEEQKILDRIIDEEF